MPPERFGTLRDELIPLPDDGLNDLTTHLPREDQSVEPVESFESVQSIESLESTCLPEYLQAVWDRVLSKQPPPAADRYVLQMRELVSLCSELQVLAGDGTFYLACRHVGVLLGIDFRKASKMLHKLEKDKVLVRISTGKVKLSPGARTKANEYRFIGGAR